MKRKILATFCTLVFSAMLTGCGTDMGNDISGDISSIIDPDMNNSAQQNSNNNSTQQNNSASSQQQNSNFSSNTPTDNTANNTRISKEEAKQIALKHAGVNEADIRDYDIDLDTENGILVYEISFESNGKEYDHDVNAQTGEISNSKNELID